MNIKLTGTKTVSRSTEGSYRSSMLTYELWLKEAKIKSVYPPEKKNALAYINYMAQMRLRPSTLNMFCCALRHTCLVLKKPLSEEHYQSYLNAVSQYRRVLVERGENFSDHKGPPLRPADMNRLLTVIDESRHPHRERDSAAFSLMWSAALRPSECAHLELDDIQFLTENILRVKIRRSKTDQYGHGATIDCMDYTTLWGISGVVERMREWLDERGSFLKIRVRGRDPNTPLLFCSSSRGWQHRACEYWRKQSGVDFTLYSFRHGFITTMAEANVGLPQLQKLARHKSPTNTAIYYDNMNMTEAAKQAQAAAEAKNGV